MSQALFREEALNAISQSQLGVVKLGAPRGLMITCICLITILVLIGWMISGTIYTRKLPVHGTFDEHHAKQILARRFGEITELNVVESQRVSRGEYLGNIAIGFEPGARAAANETSLQMKQLNALRNQAFTTNELNKARLRQSRQQTEHRLRLSLKDISLQRDKVKQLESQLKRTARLLQQGYISSLDWIRLQTTLISEQQTLNAHRQQALKMTQLLDDHSREISKLDEDLVRSNAEIDLKLSQLRLQLNRQESEFNQPMYAPVSGVVSRVSATTGTAVSPGLSILHISELNPVQTATLRIPTYAAGYVAVGQRLKLEVDAFPAERYGRIQATIVHLSDHTIEELHAGGSFVARLSVDASNLVRQDSGRYLPGMRLESHIEVESKTLLDWVIAPLKRLLPV